MQGGAPLALLPPPLRLYCVRSLYALLSYRDEVYAPLCHRESLDVTNVGAKVKPFPQNPRCVAIHQGPGSACQR